METYKLQSFSKIEFIKKIFFKLISIKADKGNHEWSLIVSRYHLMPQGKKELYI